MGRGGLKWGIVTSLILGVISILLSIKPSSCGSPFLCTSDLFFIILNFSGFLVFILFSQLGFFSINPMVSMTNTQFVIMRLIIILVNIPFYFLIGFLLKKLFRK
ncbi:MAG: hypothetical protein AABW56_01495 [Nanoarchaeota archaeon]